jgi:hypothetical protein
MKIVGFPRTKIVGLKAFGQSSFGRGRKAERMDNLSFPEPHLLRPQA